MAFQDLFSRDSSAYAAFRPRYPAALFSALAGAVARHDTAWDAGTGNGQAAVALAERFARVVATDASASQIVAAQPHPRVEYRVARSESSGLADASVDLVTVAQALHWFDIPAFFSEARRVLRPGGLLAMWTYGLMSIDPAIDGQIEAFEMTEVGPYWPAQRSLVDSGYRTIDLPFEEIDVPPFVMEHEMSLDMLAGYVGTWSSVAGYRKARGEDPVAPFIARIGEWWGDPTLPRVVRFPVTVRAGRRS